MSYHNTSESSPRKPNGSTSSLLNIKELPSYEPPPPWIPPPQRWNDSNYNSNLIQFLPRKVKLRRIKDQPLGFNIRGGPLNENGAFVSKVLSNSEAERVGLKRADKILSVNNVDFCDIIHDEAVKILKEADELDIRVQYFPYGFKLQQSVLQ